MTIDGTKQTTAREWTNNTTLKFNLGDSKPSIVDRLKAGVSI